MELQFQVTKQSIKRTDGQTPVSDSVKYLSAEFNFDSSDWDNTTKTATFRSGVDVYTVLLDANGKCLVPWELIRAGKLKVSVYGDGADEYRITADTVDVTIYGSGYSDGQESQHPTPTQYEQLASAIAEKSNVVANPTLQGGEANLGSIKIDGVDYKVPTGGGGGGAEIDDTTATSTSVYSSSKVVQLVDEAKAIANSKPSINDTTASASSVYSSEKTDLLLGAKASINDTTASTTSVYSSEKVVTLLGGKADKIGRVVSDATSYSTPLAADTFYKFGELTAFALAIDNTASTDTAHYHEYMFEFTSGATPTTFTYDNSLSLWDSTFTVAANKKYQGSVVEGVIIICEVG